uniref:Uncharacterized protein n=1 Tax=Branchiostoma floridae TaxID=7739 RepID=C3YB51_BRAFL|eukprot:XP_002606503.1 hypothetical protein BRAFLDRAFT_91914 [Branchiostoma floridae]
MQRLATCNIGEHHSGMSNARSDIQVGRATSKELGWQGANDVVKAMIFCRRIAQASASTAANARLSMPDGTVLGKARERERRGSIVSLTLLEVTPAGREHLASGDSEQVPRDMTVNNAIYNVQFSPLASTSS